VVSGTFLSGHGTEKKKARVCCEEKSGRLKERVAVVQMGIITLNAVGGGGEKRARHLSAGAGILFIRGAECVRFANKGFLGKKGGRQI